MIRYRISVPRFAAAFRHRTLLPSHKLTGQIQQLSNCNPRFPAGNASRSASEDPLRGRVPAMRQVKSSLSASNLAALQATLTLVKLFGAMVRKTLHSS